MSDRAVDAILVRMEERLANKPTYDSLTGLINRQQFHAAVEKALSMPDRVEDIGVLLWLDIDQFRLVNDVHGYETGDRLLEAVARLLERVKGAKVLGHLGADRFALMLPDIGLADAGGRAEAVCEMVRGMSFDWPGQTIGLSVSIGVVPLAAGSEDFNRLLQSADVSDLSSSAGIIHELKSLGCKVALDDFGSGQASYSYLKQLPVDWLKIATNSDDFAVVKSINEIGHFLGKKTIAEYVADDDILAKIREIGVDFAQGFGISPPLLMEDLLQTRQIA